MSKMSDFDELKLLVTCIMNNWYGLQAAISHGMGGTPAQTSSSVSRIIEEITHMCSSNETDVIDLSETLEDRIDELFNTEFEDGSVEEIANILWNHKKNFLSGNKEGVRSYISSMQNKSCEKALQRLNVCDEEMEIGQKFEDTVDEGSISENTSASSAPTYLPAEDPDGWTIPRHNRKRKN